VPSPWPDVGYIIIKSSIVKQIIKFSSTARHKAAMDSIDWPRSSRPSAGSAQGGYAMLSIAHVWSWMIHVPFLGGAIVVLALWQLIAVRLLNR
jgi:hypothetical protein